MALCRFPPEAPSSWHPFSLPAAAFSAGIGLATCWLCSPTQRINVFLSEMKERGGGGSKIINMVLLISRLPDLVPHFPGSSPHPLKPTVSSCWPPGPMGLLASCLTSHINLPSLLQISTDQISHFQDSGHKAPFSGIISN